MNKAAALLSIAVVTFAATAVAQETGALQTRQAMIDGVNPAALAIWDVTNTALDDEGELDHERIDVDGWGRLLEAAQMLELYGKRMAEAQTIVAGGPDLVAGELPPGVASKEDIQAMIDANPDGFRAVAADMAQRAAALTAAARTRDAAAVGAIASAIDEDCQTCHTRYWYLQEPTAN